MHGICYALKALATGDRCYTPFRINVACRELQSYLHLVSIKSNLWTSPDHFPICKYLHPDMFKVLLYINQLISRPAGGWTGEQPLLIWVYLLIEFPLWCNCISRHCDCGRERTQVTAPDGVPLSSLPSSYQSAAALCREIIDRLSAKPLPSPPRRDSLSSSAAVRGRGLSRACK